MRKVTRGRANAATADLALVVGKDKPKDIFFAMISILCGCKRGRGE
jgi:hypothetical protein